MKRNSQATNDILQQSLKDLQTTLIMHDASKKQLFIQLETLVNELENLAEFSIKLYASQYIFY